MTAPIAGHAALDVAELRRLHEAVPTARTLARTCPTTANIVAAAAAEARFDASARNALPALLDRLTKAEAECNEARDKLERSEQERLQWMRRATCFEQAKQDTEQARRVLEREAKGWNDQVRDHRARADDLADRLRKAEERIAELVDRSEYALGSLRVIAAHDCDLATARGFARAGIDFLERGEAGCADLRAARLAPAANGEKGGAA